MKILFVCTGNTCRSPMAAAYLMHKGLPGVTVESRGLFADGSPAAKHAVSVMAEMGIDLSGHISRGIVKQDVEQADSIICLSPSHLAQLRAAGVDGKKLFLLGKGISDPFGGDEETYRRCRDEIISEIDLLINSGFLSGISVIPAASGHIKDIALLEAACFSQPWSKEGIADSIRAGTRFFVAETGGRTAGYVGITTVVDEGYITNLAVFPQYRRKGVAGALLRAVFQLAKQQGLSFVSLEVRRSNLAAISLYEKFGFKTEGERKDFYENPREDALIMTKRFDTDENTEH